MKKLIYILLFTVSSAIAAPTQSSLQVVCDDMKTLYQYFVDGEYEEAPFWAGYEDTNKTSFVLLTNKETGTWTMIQYNSKKGCVIAAGDRWKIAPQKPNI